MYTPQEVKSLRAWEREGWEINQEERVNGDAIVELWNPESGETCVLAFHADAPNPEHNYDYFHGIDADFDGICRDAKYGAIAADKAYREACREAYAEQAAKDAYYERKFEREVAA